jgi:hypothetical protein
MMNDPTTKISSAHRERIAVIYVRQSTQYQVANNLESQRRRDDLDPTVNEANRSATSRGRRRTSDVAKVSGGKR